MNRIAENILYLYLIVFLSVLGFDIACIFVRKWNEKHLENLKNNLLRFLSQNKKNIRSLKFQKQFIKKLKKMNYFIAFTNIVENMDKQEKEVFLRSLKYTFLKILKHYQNEESIRQTYFVHFLAENSFIYKDNKNALINYLIKCTTTTSIYLRENALHALYQSGRVEYIKEAFSKMNYLNIAHHHKLLTDGLLKFKGNSKELANCLLLELKDYNENYQIACINYFSYKKIECQEILFQYLTNKKEKKEVRLACLRYFKNIYYQPVEKVLYDFLEDEKQNWEYAAIAASTLSNYQNKETVKRLITSLKSYNWYVRNNAAMSITNANDIEILQTILQKIDDQYAKDALLYQMRLQRKLG